MEWDKIYAINGNYIDPIAKRYFSVSVEGAVNLFVDNMETKLKKLKLIGIKKIKNQEKESKKDKINQLLKKKMQIY